MSEYDVSTSELQTIKQAVADVKDGNVDRYEVIVRMFSKILHSFVRQRVSSAENANDIVQESFIKLYKNISNFDIEKPLKPYLLQIAANTIKDHFRSHRVMSSLTGKESYEEAEYIDANTLMSKMNPTQKSIFQLIIAGYDYISISEKIGKPVSTIKTIVRRTRQKFITSLYT